MSSHNLRAVASASVDSPSEDDTEFLSAVGRRVRERREGLGMTRRLLAQQAEVSERYLAQLETGEGNVSIILLRRIAGALNLKPAVLLFDDDEESVERRLVQRLLQGVPAHRLEAIAHRLLRTLGEEATARRKRIALIGLRGAGKTTLGTLLARELRVPFVELNREVQQEARLPVSEVFNLYGQAGFRRIEHECLERVLAEHDSAVISTGGGLVSQDETFELLLARCYTVWLRAKPEEHMSRVLAQGDFRPMAGNEDAMNDLRRILAAREPLYRKADAVVDTSGQTPEQTLDRLIEVLHA